MARIFLWAAAVTSGWIVGGLVRTWWRRAWRARLKRQLLARILADSARIEAERGPLPDSGPLIREDRDR